MNFYDELVNLTDEQINEVIVEANFPSRFLPKPASRATIASQLVEWAGQGSNSKALRDALDKVCLRIEVKAPSDEDITGSRSPIIIAIEENDDPIDESQLLPIERHLTVRLAKDTADALRDFGKKLIEAETARAILDHGADIWRILAKAEPRLSGLLEVIDKSRREEPRYAQPVAWTGKADLLSRIYRALMAACSDSDAGVSALLSAGYGSHYFHALDLSGVPRRMARRQESADGAGIKIQKLDITDETSEAEILPRITGLTSAEVALIAARDNSRPLLQLSEMTGRLDHAATRLALGFGCCDITAEFLTSIHATIPCVSLAGLHLFQKSLLDEIFNTFPDKLPHQSVPTIISTFRNKLLLNAFRDGAIDTFKHALFWTTWSWVGRPLFAREFGEMIDACYPHLMGLRSVAKKEWYVDRKIDIPKPYLVENLVASGGSGFHLYLTGAGGTGKSCYLHNVFEKLRDNMESVLPVWYKVDAPSSEWENVCARIKEETLNALEKRLGRDQANSMVNMDKDLPYFLTDLVANLLRRQAPVKEVVVFIDQLERTFESGDNPDQRRLAKISGRFIELLKAVKDNNGVRIYIASRKQYLPDFLISFEKAFEHNLHFFVLQEVKHPDEQIDFVKTELKWCKRQRLVDSTVELEDDACGRIARETGGHPLKMMLALIRAFSQGLKGRIGEADIDKLDPKPWEDLFYADESLAAKDELDWYFFLAMAHARTEIVRFSEVWWRLRLVSPKLTERAVRLGRQNFLEHLWLEGHLGRTIHARPLDSDKAGFLEFFHANLRDHLLTTVMNYGGEERLKGRKGGMPPAWRALDRLTAAARDWKQSQQLLIRDDVRILMEQKDVFVEATTIDKKNVEAFYLLFMRDDPDYREELFKSAKECFVYSALAHDIGGRWAFRELFRNQSEQVSLCRKWLRRADRESRIRILQYMVELRSVEANTALCELIYEDGGGELNDVWQQLASIFADKLFAARYRGAFMVSAVDYLLRRNIAFPSDNRQSNRFGEFCVAACGGERDELLGLLDQMSRESASLHDKKLQSAVSALVAADALLLKWLNASSDSGIDVAVNSREIHDYIPPRIEIRIGDGLSDAITESMVERWKRRIAEDLGLPLPPFTLTRGEVPGALSGNNIGSGGAANCDNETDEQLSFELSLLINGHVAGVGRFYPGLVETLRRRWDLENLSPPRHSRRCYNEAYRECVIWVAQSELNALGWKKASTSFEEAILAWLLELMRRQVGDVFTMQEIIPLIDGIFNLGDPRLNISDFLGAISGDYPALWQVFVNLARERVPLQGRAIELIVELQKVVIQRKSTDTVFITQRLRELSRDRLCRVFTDETNQLPVMLMSPDIESGLVNRLKVQEGRHSFALTAEKKLALAAAISGHFETVLRTEDVAPVLVCDQSVRAPLFQLIQRFDPRIHALSLTELSEEVRPRLPGDRLISGVTLDGDL